MENFKPSSDSKILSIDYSDNDFLIIKVLNEGKETFLRIKPEHLFGNLTITPEKTMELHFNSPRLLDVIPNEKLVVTTITE